MSSKEKLYSINNSDSDNRFNNNQVEEPTQPQVPPIQIAGGKKRKTKKNKPKKGKKTKKAKNVKKSKKGKKGKKAKKTKRR
jgi:hypothetical protein